MLLYTVVPLHQVLEGWDAPRPEPVELQINGRTVLVEPDSPYGGRIVRLLSCDPKDFLDPAYQPGRRVLWWGPR
ncbi:hypothetical protein DYI95_005165 [Thermaerobacter sp. PB12/4term]|uniref:YlzJ-like family protein n=1 Tax=Thermaerobacter sp. PB12/4term TaxID=2293838 RepID=UPI000E32646B|nr:YlzJ-like family protein [Thermaerobacter sp. PB12/4term]QIA26989.1 hypothetical protein DYI95_005165 [Thermaerobacter sp. PB12/4term]